MEGTHKLKLAIVGKSQKPRALKDVMKKLPVIYYANKKAWFTQSIFTDWFHQSFVPAVKNYQINTMGIPEKEIKALLLLDNAPAHPSVEILTSSCGKIECMFLPANTTSILQPMDQGIIVSFKRFYRSLQLNEVLDFDDDRNCGEKTLSNLKKYNIKNAIFNMSLAWNKVSSETIKNCFKKLSNDETVEFEMENVAINDFENILQSHDRSDIDEWLHIDEIDPGHAVYDNDENDSSISGDDESDVELIEIEGCNISSMEAVSSLNKVLNYLELKPEYITHYENIHTLRSIIMDEHYKKMKQRKITDFFNKT